MQDKEQEKVKDKIEELANANKDVHEQMKTYDEKTEYKKFEKYTEDFLKKLAKERGDKEPIFQQRRESERLKESAIKNDLNRKNWAYLENQYTTKSGAKIYIECKHYESKRTTIREQEVKKLVDDRIECRAQHGVMFVSPGSRLSEGALQLCKENNISIIRADQHGKANLERVINIQSACPPTQILLTENGQIDDRSTSVKNGQITYLDGKIDPNCKAVQNGDIRLTQIGELDPESKGCKEAQEFKAAKRQTINTYNDEEAKDLRKAPTKKDKSLDYRYLKNRKDGKNIDKTEDKRLKESEKKDTLESIKTMDAAGNVKPLNKTGNTLIEEVKTMDAARNVKPLNKTGNTFMEEEVKLTKAGQIDKRTKYYHNLNEEEGDKSKELNNIIQMGSKKERSHQMGSEKSMPVPHYAPKEAEYQPPVYSPPIYKDRAAEYESRAEDYNIRKTKAGNYDKRTIEYKTYVREANPQPTYIPPSKSTASSSYYSGSSGSGGGGAYSGSSGSGGGGAVHLTKSGRPDMRYKENR